MTTKTARTLTFVFTMVALLGTVTYAQICPPTPAGFDGLTGAPLGVVNNNSAILDFITGTNSSDAVNNDNVAEAHMGEAIAIQFQDVRVPAGSPLTIAYSIGVIQTPLLAPTVVDGDIWIDVTTPGNFFGLVDGLGLTRPFPDPLGTTPGPTNLLNLNVGVTVDPGALGVCVTFQTLVIDVLAPAPFNIAFSNPILFGIAPVIRGMTPQIAPTGGTIKMDIPGQAAGGESIIFPQGQLTATNFSQEVTVPFDALSGTVSGTINVWNTIPSIDGLGDYVVVTDSTPVLMATPGPITLNVDANLPVIGTSRASVISSVANATATATFSVNLNAGDIIDIEVFSTDLATQQILDGLGNLLNPLAQEGFDPFVTLQQGSNLDNLVWEDPVLLGTVGPFNLITDDNSGPMNNARLRWQAKWTDSYNIIVNNALGGAYVTGNFLLNIVVTPGSPCVQKFNVTGAPVNSLNRINITPQGGTLDLVCVNLTPGNTYAVDFIPKAGAPFTTRTVTGVLATSTNLLTVTVPTAAATDLPMGLHQVRLRDEVTMAQGLIWDNSAFTPNLGVLPDLMSIAGATVTTATVNLANTNGGDIPVTTLNSESILLAPVALNAGNLSNAFVAATDPGGSGVIYCEALGLAQNFFSLFDSTFDTDALANNLVNNGIYNPSIKVFPFGLANTGPANDDDGVLPFPLFPNPMGIGYNAAIIDTFFPLANPMGGVYRFFVNEFVFFDPQNAGQGALNAHACLINIVIQ